MIDETDELEDLDRMPIGVQSFALLHAATRARANFDLAVMTYGKLLNAPLTDAEQARVDRALMFLRDLHDLLGLIFNQEEE